MRIKSRLYPRLFNQRAFAKPPLIIVGMHRSGTTLLVKLLEQCGTVFMGADQTRNAESRCFQQINRLTLEEFGCSWRALSFLPSPERMAVAYQPRVESVHRLLSRTLVTTYWRGHVPLLWGTNNHRWGWKDPRTSLLLPFWKRIFPDATVVHIYRDGRDVALSLLQRDLKGLQDETMEQAEQRTRLTADFKVWETYIERIETGMQAFEQQHTLQYERLLASPREELTRLLETIRLPLPEDWNKVTSMIDASRTKRFNSEAFAWTKGLFDDNPTLQRLGYLSPAIQA